MMLEALRRYGASVQCALSATEATATLLAALATVSNP
jgi:hypothetical protein